MREIDGGGQVFSRTTGSSIAVMEGYLCRPPPDRAAPPPHAHGQMRSVSSIAVMDFLDRKFEVLVPR